jgi:energy-coupling factor transporter ATP-binding protein EcfA2
MNLIDKFEIDGFWDTHQVKAQLHRDVTFFIGPNGTGKTTLINLLAAALTGDFLTLNKIPFKKITISLVPEEPKKFSPSITVSKTRKKDSTVDNLDYLIKKGPSTEFKFSMEEIDEVIVRRAELQRRYLHDYYRKLHSGLGPVLGELVQVQWLSVHRTTTLDNSREERPYESSVDRKLESLSNELVRYFATFSNQKDEKVRQFQEYIFSSLLEQTNLSQLFDEKTIDRIDRNQMTMVEIFKELHVSSSQLDHQITSFFARASTIVQNYVIKRSGIPLHDVGILIGLRRIEGVIDQWRLLQMQLNEIFAQRDRFVDINNSLLLRKKMEINDSNELVFVSRTGKVLTPQMLSSGEKQLLILLSEVLLQKQTPSVLITDEPELSLHVSWQEKLVGSLRSLNSRVQIIAATHSPDIVGPLFDRAIDMESIIP